MCAVANSGVGFNGGGKSWRLCDVPHSIIERLCRLLDRTCWRNLASEYLHHSQEDIEFLEYRERHGFSPSRHILQQWKQEDPLADELFVILSRMRFYQAMQLIKDYVDGQLMVLLEHGEGSKHSVLRAMRQRLTDAQRQELQSSAASSDLIAKTSSQEWHETSNVASHTTSTIATSSAESIHIEPRPVVTCSEIGSNVSSTAPLAVSSQMTSESAGVLEANLQVNVQKNHMVTKLCEDDITRLLRSTRFSGNMKREEIPDSLPQQQQLITTDLNDSVLSLSATHWTGGVGALRVDCQGRLHAEQHSPDSHSARANSGGSASSRSAAATHTVSSNLQASTTDSNAEHEDQRSPSAVEVDFTNFGGDLANIPQIKYAELQMGSDNWSRDRLLGSGGFGTVYLSTWKNTTWAVKRVAQPTRTSAVAGAGAVKADEHSAMELRQMLEELRILNACRHDNILPVCGFSRDGPEPLLLYQLMANGSLLDRLVCKGSTPPLEWPQRLNIARGAARGLQFLHTRAAAPLIHGDIKSANILLDHHMEPRLGDFGLARQLPHTRYTSLQVSRIHGTRPYLPDEYLRSRRLSDKVDTYSFGVVLYEIATGLPAYDDRRSVKLLRELVEEAMAAGVLRRLADARPSSSEYDVFDNLVRLGLVCVHPRPRQRPQMALVFSELEAAVVARERIIRSGAVAVNVSSGAASAASHHISGVGNCAVDCSSSAERSTEDEKNVMSVGAHMLPSLSVLQCAGVSSSDLSATEASTQGDALRCSLNKTAGVSAAVPAVISESELPTAVADIYHEHRLSDSSVGFSNSSGQYEPASGTLSVSLSSSVAADENRRPLAAAATSARQSAEPLPLLSALGLSSVSQRM